MRSNKKFIMAGAAVAVVAASALTLVGAGTASAATVYPAVSANHPYIPGIEPITGANPFQFADNGPTYYDSNGNGLVTRFYGYRHCYFNDRFTAGRDTTACFTIYSGNDSGLVLLLDAEGTHITTVHNK